MNLSIIIEQKLRSWRFSNLVILFLTSLFVFIIATNWSSQATARENTSSNLPLVYAYVQLDGRELFPVAAMAATNSNSNSTTILPMNMRVKMYEERLQEIIRTGFDPETLTVTTRNLDEQTFITATDNRKLPPQQIGTVTQLDAQIHGLPVLSLAKQWSQIIRTALIQAQQERQPEYLQRQLLTAGAIVLGMILVCGLFIIWQKRLKVQWEDLLLQQPTPDNVLLTEQTENLESKEIAANQRTRIVAVMEQKVVWQRQKNLNALKRGLLHIGHVVVWLIGLTWILGLFPYTRNLQEWLFTKWELVGIVLGTYAAIKASVVGIDYLSKGLTEELREATTFSQRRTLRLTTLFHVLKGIISYGLIIIGILLILAHLRIPIGPLLAGAGILGFAISFSSQNLIRDIINGSLIVLEDQYAIGDVIAVGEAAGLVEEMNLRMTQLRGEGGRLTTIPNSSIAIVHNLSKDWSRIDFTIQISHEADVNQAIKIIREVAEQMQRDPEWQEQIIDPVNVLGVNDLSETGVEILLWIKTQPLKQFIVGREFRRRLKLALDEENIAMGIPLRLLG